MIANPPDCPKCYTSDEFCCGRSRTRHNNVVDSNQNLHDTLRERIRQLDLERAAHEHTVALLEARAAESVEALKRLARATLDFLATNVITKELNTETSAHQKALLDLAFALDTVAQYLENK